jgi:D-3-phosphoglycerate dehydrogenase
LTYGQVQDPRKLADLLVRVDAAVLGVERVDAAVLDAAARLKIISRFGVGFDAIDLEALKRKGIRLAITRGCMGAAVARQTLAFLLSITFNLLDHNRRLKQGRWERFPNRSCSEMTLGVVGMGEVGGEVACLARALGYTVVAYSRSRSNVEGVSFAGSPRELILNSDVVSLHLRLTAETREMVSGEVLNWLTGKSLINTARGGLVSEIQVLEALNAGRLCYYATDVFESEPIQGISQELARHERVICTPHVAAMDPATAGRMLRRALENATNCLGGLHGEVNSYVL